MKRTNSRRQQLAGLAMALTLAVTGCVGPARPLVNKLQEVGQNEVIVVGRIVLDPPLGEGEQNLKTFSAGIINPSARQYRNKVILLTDKENRRITEPSIGDYRDRIETGLGETFYVRAKNEPFYVVRSEIMMDLTAAGMEKAILPAGYRIDLRPGDRAVYIGTIKYHRDEFFATNRVELIDEYGKESATFKNKFGNGIKLRKALASVPR